MLDRFTDGYQERLPALTEEAIRLKHDVILAAAVINPVAARKATLIPIVTPALADAVHLGLIASQARRGQHRGHLRDRDYPRSRSNLRAKSWAIFRSVDFPGMKAKEDLACVDG
jgi:hypothetical protein